MVTVRTLIVATLGHEAHVTVVRETPLQHRVIQTFGAMMMRIMIIKMVSSPSRYSTASRI